MKKYTILLIFLALFFYGCGNFESDPVETGSESNLNNDFDSTQTNTQNDETTQNNDNTTTQDENGSNPENDYDSPEIDSNNPENDSEEPQSDNETKPDTENSIGIVVDEPDNWISDSKKTPKSLHLTYQNDPATKITFQWQTEITNSSNYKPKVWLVPAEYVKNGDTSKFEQNVIMPYIKELVFEGKGEPYCSSYVPCGAGKEDKMLWVVEATGLKPNTVYFYRVGTFDSFDEATGQFVSPNLSASYYFRTGVEKGKEDTFLVGFGSDSQSWSKDLPERLKTIRSTYGKNISFWLFGGDLVELGSEQEMSDWMMAMEPILPYYAFMPVQGNHDVLDGVFFGNWALPKMGSPLQASEQEKAWSFNFGNAHFVGLNSKSEDMVKKLVTWLEQDLKTAREDSNIKWIVVIFHHPAYSSSSAHGSTDYIQRHFVPIFDKYGVDICFSGHDHDYERTKPLKAGQTVAAGKGTVYIVSGGFYSQKSYGNGTSSFTEVSYNGDIKSHVVLSFEGDTIRGEAHKGNHELLDKFELKK